MPKHYRILHKNTVLYKNAPEAKQDGAFVRLDRRKPAHNNIDAICSYGFACCTGIYLNSKDRMSLAHVSSISNEDFVPEEIDWITKKGRDKYTVTLITNPACGDGDKSLSEEDKEKMRETQAEIISDIIAIFEGDDFPPEKIDYANTLKKFGRIAISRDGVIDNFSKVGEENVIFQELQLPKPLPKPVLNVPANPPAGQASAAPQPMAIDAEVKVPAPQMLPYPFKPGAKDMTFLEYENARYSKPDVCMQPARPKPTYTSGNYAASVLRNGAVTPMMIG